MLTNRLHEIPVYVSYTAARRFDDCQFSEVLLRAGVPRAQKDRTPFFVGSVVHDALEWVVLNKRPLPDDLLVRLADDRLHKPGYSWPTPSARATTMARLGVCLNAMVPTVLGLLDQGPDTVADVEVDLYRDFPGGGHVPPYRMTARVDLMLRSPGRVRIIDFKTSKSAPDVTQLQWYVAVLRAGLPSDVEIEAGYVLHDGRYQSLMVTPDEESASITRAGDLARALVTPGWQANPSGYKCARCRVRVSCSYAAVSRGTGRMLGGGNGGN